MSLAVSFRPVALMELDEATAWYKKQKAGLEFDFLQEVQQTLSCISTTPMRFAPVRGEVRRALLRRFPYAIHFVPEPQKVVVLAVFHVRRDPRHIESRE